MARALDEAALVEKALADDGDCDRRGRRAALDSDARDLRVVRKKRNVGVLPLKTLAIRRERNRILASTRQSWLAALRV